MATTKRISIRLTPEAEEKLEELTRESGMKPSEVVRELILNGKVAKCDCEEYRKILYHLSRIGNNINQIAKKANLEKELDEKILNELKKIKELLEILTE